MFFSDNIGIIDGLGPKLYIHTYSLIKSNFKAKIFKILFFLDFTNNQTDLRAYFWVMKIQWLS